MKAGDCAPIAAAFRDQGWDKPVTQYQDYLRRQENNEIIVLTAFMANAFRGYCVVKWISDYQYFQENNIPEIADLNVLKKYRNKGIGKSLIAHAEDIIFAKSKMAGIGTALLPDYGAALKLYISLGYRPDGLGITYKNERCGYGTAIRANNDLVLWMTKASLCS